jgi:hypothetical protein
MAKVSLATQSKLGSGGEFAMHNLSQRAATALAQFSVDGDWARLVSEDKELRVLDKPLLHGQAVAMARQGPLLWVLIDMLQDGALEQLRELIESWPFAVLGDFGRSLNEDLGVLAS